MTIVLKTSSTAIMQRMCVSQDTPDLRGRADDNRAQDLELRACSACVSQDTPDLRGRADDNRAQDLETLRACSACVSQDTPDLRGRADDNRAQDLERCEHAAHVCVTRHT